jgi:phage tail-like protein
MEEDINYISNYFEPGIVPREFLEWLAGCVGIDNVKIWDEARLRRLISNAYKIFRERGTRQGISDIVEYYTGETPIIIEYFQYCDFMKDKEVGEILRKLYGNNPYEFNVFVRQEVVPDMESSLTLSSILEWQKPAHTEARLVVLKPNICLNSYSFLGMNTFLTEQTVLKIDNNTSLPYNTILVNRENI